MLPKYIIRILDGKRFVLTERNTYMHEDVVNDRRHYHLEYTYNDLMLDRKGFFKHD